VESSLENYTWGYLDSPAAEPMQKCISEFVIKNKPNTIIDIGCGPASWMKYIDIENYNITLVDNLDEVVQYLTEKYKDFDNVEVVKADAWTYNNNKKYDLAVLSGILYYCKNNPYTPETFVDHVKETFGVNSVVVAEPFPLYGHYSPDLLSLMNKWSWQAKQFLLDIRLGHRVVFNIDVSKTLLGINESKTKSTDQNKNKQVDFNDQQLKYGVYPVNTEVIDCEFNGRVFPTTDRSHYIGVCSGLKLLYKIMLDESKDYSIDWIDISPTAILYRMYSDMEIHRGHRDLNVIKQNFQDHVENSTWWHQPSKLDMNEYVKEQLNFLAKDTHEFNEMLDNYANVDKTYSRLDAVRNVKKLKSLIKPNTLLWYSNVFEWHQWTHNIRTHDRWNSFLNCDTIGKKPDLKIDNRLDFTGLMINYVSHVMKSLGILYGLNHDQEIDNLYYTLYKDKDYRSVLEHKSDNTIIQFNNHNLTIANPKGKIKIYFSATKEYARNNYKFSEQIRDYKSKSVETDNFRAEYYEWITGDFVESIENKESLRSIVLEFFKNKPHHMWYPYDLNSNNIIFSRNKIYFIDFDYMMLGPTHEFKDKLLNIIG
jgi:hypothetical protein